MLFLKALVLLRHQCLLVYHHAPDESSSLPQHSTSQNDMLSMLICGMALHKVCDTFWKSGNCRTVDRYIPMSLFNLDAIGYYQTKLRFISELIHP